MLPITTRAAKRALLEAKVEAALQEYNRAKIRDQRDQSYLDSAKEAYDLAEKSFASAKQMLVMAQLQRDESLRKMTDSVTAYYFARIELDKIEDSPTDVDVE